MWDPELPWDDTWPDTGRGHLNDLESDVVGQGASIDENTAQLVDTALPCWEKIDKSDKFLGGKSEMFVYC